MASTFIAFIDEAGCEGGTHGKGGSEWFALTAIVTTRDNLPELSKAVADFKAEYKRSPEWTFKFTDLDPKRKIRAAHYLSEQKVLITSMLIHKPSLRDEKLRSDHKRLYFYCGKFLIERISWICRDAKANGQDPRCEIIFSERKKFPYDEMKEYVRKLPETDPRSRAHWTHIDAELISAIPHNKSDGCILADVAASALTLAVEYTEYDITDTRPLLKMQKRYYAPARVYKGNSIKLFPSEAEGMVLTDQRFDWARHYFGF